MVAAPPKPKTAELTRHYLSEVWPDLEPARFEELVTSMRTLGFDPSRPIVVLPGTNEVLDGWSRYRAAGVAGVKPVVTEYEGDDHVGFVIAMNAARRHTSALEIARAVAKCRDWKTVGRPAVNDDVAVDRPRTNAEMAKEAGVSEATVTRAKREVRRERGELPPEEPRPVAEVKEKTPAQMREAVLRQRVSELETERDTLVRQTRLLEDQASPEEAGRLATLNAQIEEINVLKNSNARLQTQINEVKREIFALRKANEELQAAEVGVQGALFSDVLYMGQTFTSDGEEWVEFEMETDSPIGIVQVAREALPENVKSGDRFVLSFQPYTGGDDVEYAPVDEVA